MQLALIEYLNQYEQRYQFPVKRPVRAFSVERTEFGLPVRSDDKHWDTRVADSTGIRPLIPR